MSFHTKHYRANVTAAWFLYGDRTQHRVIANAIHKRTFWNRCPSGQCCDYPSNLTERPAIPMRDAYYHLSPFSWLIGKAK